MKPFRIGDFHIGGSSPVVLIAGPCVLESEERALFIGRQIKEICGRIGMPYIFKASYDKANRSSYHSFRGPGLKEGLAILDRIRKELRVPILSDIHCVEHVGLAAEVLDILQIPAFLCRQTDLIFAAAKTGRVINVKKGQFLSPLEMGNITLKIQEAGNEQILLTERGSSFGYNNLVVDMRSFSIMRSFGFPVVFDATHSVQLPGGAGITSSGQREFVPGLARAATAIGIDALFLEVHDNPQEALSDGPNMVPLSELETLLRDVQSLDLLIRERIRK